MAIKNYEIHIGDSRISAIRFGKGTEHLVIIPGLGDGMTTVKGKAMLGRLLGSRYAGKFCVTIISGQDDLPAGTTTQSMAKELYQAMQALKIEKAHIAGLSLGGMIAQHLAADHPEVVDRLVLVSAAPAADTLLTENLGRWTSFARMGAFLGLMIDTTEKSHPEKKLKLLRPFYPYMGSMAKKMNVERFCTMASAWAGHDATEKLFKITAPTLIVGGKLDRTLDIGGSRMLSDLISGSTLKIYENQGHALYEDEPDFHKTVLSFLNA